MASDPPISTFLSFDPSDLENFGERELRLLQKKTLDVAGDLEHLELKNMSIFGVFGRHLHHLLPTILIYTLYCICIYIYIFLTFRDE